MRREFNYLGVTIIYLRPERTRVCEKVIKVGYSTWALLPNGRVALSDDRAFKRLRPQSGQPDEYAEALYKLGVIDQRTYDKAVSFHAELGVLRERSSATFDARHALQKLEELGDCSFISTINYLKPREDINVSAIWKKYFPAQ